MTTDPTTMETLVAECNQLRAELDEAKITISRYRSDDLLPLGVAARLSRVTQKWLRAEADEGRVPYLRAGKHLLFHLPTVRAMLVERAKKGGGE